MENVAREKDENKVVDNIIELNKLTDSNNGHPQRSAIGKKTFSWE